MQGARPIQTTSIQINGVLLYLLMYTWEVLGYLHYTNAPRTELRHSEYKTGVSVIQPLTSLCPCVVASVAESLHCSANTLCQHSPQRKCRHYHMAEVPLLS